MAEAAAAPAAGKANPLAGMGKKLLANLFNGKTIGFAIIVSLVVTSGAVGFENGFGAGASELTSRVTDGFSGYTADMKNHAPTFFGGLWETGKGIAGNIGDAFASEPAPSQG